jgi:hypothetical protein
MYIQIVYKKLTTFFPISQITFISIKDVSISESLLNQLTKFTLNSKRNNITGSTFSKFNSLTS